MPQHLPLQVGNWAPLNEFLAVGSNTDGTNRGVAAVINPKDSQYAGGCKSDGQVVDDAAITAATTALTSASGQFVVGDIGKVVYVGGAGQVQTTGTTNTSTLLSGLASTAGIYAGATVTGPDIPASTTVVGVPSTTTVTLSQAATGSHGGGTYSFSSTLSTTISGFVSATQVTLAAVASFTVASANAKWGTDDSAAFTAAVAAYNVGKGQILQIPGGMTIVAGGYTLSKSGAVVGTARSIANNTSKGDLGSVLLSTGPVSADMFTVTAQCVRFEGVGLDGNYGAQTAANNGIAVNISLCEIHQCEINAFSGDGVKYGGTNVQACRMTDTDFRLNQAHGINLSVSSATDNDFSLINIGTSGLSGINVAAPGNNFGLLHTWGNGTLKVVADQAGLRSQGSVASCRFANSYFETNNGYGVYTLNSGVVGWSFSNCTFWKNGIAGAYMFTAKNVSFVGCIIYDNGQISNNAGLINDTGTDWCVSGCNFYDDQGASKTQTVGYQEQNTANFNTIVGNSLRAANHKTGSATIVGANNVPVSASMGTLNQV